MRSDNLYKVPADIPIPEDDGAARHLLNKEVPSVGLPCTSGYPVSLSTLSDGFVVVYCYPRTGRPHEEALGGTAIWNSIPGARGCTPQSCAYRDCIVNGIKAIASPPRLSSVMCQSAVEASGQ